MPIWPYQSVSHREKPDQRVCYGRVKKGNAQITRTGIKVQIDRLARRTNLDRTEPLAVISLSKATQTVSCGFDQLGLRRIVRLRDIGLPVVDN